MAIRLSGMISGMDTDSLVKELVSAYSIKKDKYVKSKTKLEWKMDAWKSLNTKLYSFYTNKLSPMRFSSAYSKKTATASDSTKAIVKADGNAVNGTQSIEINKLATTGYLTGAQLDGSVKQNTKLSDLNGGSASGTFKITVDGNEKRIDITDDMNVGQLVTKLKDAGVNASFDETNQRFFISSKTSGLSHDFSLTGDSNGVALMKKLGIYSLSEADKAQYEKIRDYTDEQLENMALNDYLKNQISVANQTYSDKNSELAKKNSDLNKQLTYAKLSEEGKATNYASIKKTVDSIQKEIDKLRADGGDAKEIENKEKQLEAANETLTLLDSVNTQYGIKIAIDSNGDAKAEKVGTEPSEAALEAYKDSLSDEINKGTELIKANNEAIEANNKLVKKPLTTDEIMDVEYTSYDKTTNSVVTGNKISTAYASDETYKKYYEKYVDERTTAENILNGTIDSTSGAKGLVRISGSDSEIVLNGATFTSNTNNYSINGLTITATAVTAPGEKLTITTETDVDGIYNMIKDTIKEYNELIKEMDTLYGAESAKGYEPLTDEEKDALSDTEVEKWEKKIKDALLRRDSTLGGVASAMKTAMSSSYEINGKKYSLSSFGINTLGYFASGDNEKGVYHIDGDKDDGTTSGNADKLRQAIASDPDAVIGFFSKLTGGLYDTLTKKMSSSSVSSAYTIYNDKQMKKNYEQYDETIEKWEEKLENIENKYYDQFAKMESAMAKLQASSSSFASMFGGGY